MGEDVEDADTNDSLPQYTQTPGLTKGMQGKTFSSFLWTIV